MDDGPGGKDSRAAIDVSLLFFPDTFPPRSSMGSRPRPARRARISPREDVDKGTDSTPRRARRVRAPRSDRSAPFVLRATGRSRNRPNAATRGSSKHVRWCHFSSVEPFGRILDPQTTRAVRYATATAPRRRPKIHSSPREPSPREPSANPHPAHLAEPAPANALEIQSASSPTQGSISGKRRSDGAQAPRRGHRGRVPRGSGAHPMPPIDSSPARASRRVSPALARGCFNIPAATRTARHTS